MTARRNYRYYDFVMAALVTVLRCSSVVGPANVATFRGFNFGAGVLFFPISCIFGDILTEVCGTPARAGLAAPGGCDRIDSIIRAKR